MGSGKKWSVYEALKTGKIISKFKKSYVIWND